MNFGKYVKILRKNNSLTQEEFANKLGVSRQTVSNWEQNITTPNLNDIEKICKVFNIELNYFCKKGKSSNNLFKKVLKIYLIINAIIIVLALIGLLIFKMIYERNIFYGSKGVTCFYNNEKYEYFIEYNKKGKVKNVTSYYYTDKDTYEDWFNNLNRYIYNYEKRKYDYDKLINYIEDVYSLYNGTCKD